MGQKPGSKDKARRENKQDTDSWDESDSPSRTKNENSKLRESSSHGKTESPAFEPDENHDAQDSDAQTGWFGRIGNLTSSAFRFARKTTGNSVRVGRSMIPSQDQLKVMMAAGASLRDLREVAGLTISELSDAINLKDRTFWEAVEDGTATISFELILRLAALLARNDPIPFVLKYTRTYNPELWRILNDWGLGRLPLQYEREREFVNIYRRHDAARQLSDADFAKVLAYTRQSFETALHFAASYGAIPAPAEKDRKTSRETSQEKPQPSQSQPEQPRPHSGLSESATESSQNREVKAQPDSRSTEKQTEDAKEPEAPVAKRKEASKDKSGKSDSGESRLLMSRLRRHRGDSGKSKDEKG